MAAFQGISGRPLGWAGGFAPQTCGKLYAQATLTDWLSTSLSRFQSPQQIRAAQLLYRRLLGADTIGSRVSCVPDVDEPDPRRWRLFAEAARLGQSTAVDQQRPGFEPSMEHRMQLYSETALAIASAAFPAEELPAAHMIQVSCTGYESPAALQRVIAARGWGQATRYLHLGHMGCYAAIPALGVASSLLSSLPPTRGQVRRAVSLLHIELCTLHLSLTSTTPGQVVVHHLFADGAIRYDVADERFPGPCFALLGSFEVTLAHSADAMTWQLTSTGFRMGLARDVPALITQNLPGLVNSFLADFGLYRADIDRFAIHPGGARIIEGVAACLEVPLEKVTHSQAMFHQRGNMSSATLPHIWHALATDPKVAAGELVLSLAFGPGLTVTGNLMGKLEAREDA